MKKFTTAVPILLLASVLMGQSFKSPEVQSSLDAIQGYTLRAYIQFLADDITEGRGVGTPGDMIAEKYIASQFQAMGLKPGNGDSYFQTFPLIGIHADPSMSLHFKHADKTIKLNYYDDFIAVPGNQESLIQIDKAELVFAGYGIVAPEFNWNDFKNSDVKGKILLIMNNDPDTGDPNFFGGKTRLYYGRWDYKYEEAARQGAAGVIIIHTTPSASYPWQVVQTSWFGEQFELPRSDEPCLKVKAWATESRCREIVRMAGFNLDTLRQMAQSRDFQPVDLGIRTAITIHSRIRTLETANVLGLFPGKDPEKSEEVVIYTAHHDHLGLGKSADGDSIYNGAVDNATGVAAVLNIAQAYTRLPHPPDRSLLFMAVSAEESGLLGSDYYAHHPTFPVQKIAGVINLDAMNIFGRTRDVSSIGFGKTSIDTTFVRLAEEQNRYVRPDQHPERGSFYRSDHFSFAKVGVPSVYLGGGHDFIGRSKAWVKEHVDPWVGTHYHQPSDEYSPDWNLDGMIEDTKLAFMIGLNMADQKPMPEWVPGDEFEKIRKNQ